MLKLILCSVLSLTSTLALAVVPRVDCSGCSSLREFGNFGAASLYRSTGPAGPAVGNDKIWVDNPTTALSAFVDVDTPMTTLTFMGTEIPIPNLAQTKINATWADGSGSATWVLPNAVVDAIGEGIEAAENHGTPAVTPEEVAELPGLSGTPSWDSTGWSAYTPSAGTLSSGLWVFYVTGFGGQAVPVVTVVECAWKGFC